MRKGRVWVLGAVAILGANLLFLGPSLAASIGNTRANVLYLALRFVVVTGLAYGLARWCGRNRLQSMSTTILVAFLDQTVFKTLWVVSEMRKDAALWQDTSVLAIVAGMGMSFVILVPMILGITFVAASLGASATEKSSRA